MHIRFIAVELPTGYVFAALGYLFDSLLVVIILGRLRDGIRVVHLLGLKHLRLWSLHELVCQVTWTVRCVSGPGLHAGIYQFRADDLCLRR